MTTPQATFVQLEPTTRCNFTCGFCCGRHMPQEDLAWETFEATLAAFPELRHVELQGEGESILHPRFLDMVDALRARDVQVSFITNGSLLKPAVVDRLLDAGVDKISVSIESPDPVAFQQIRGGKLDKVLRNLEHLMAERRRRGLDRPVVGLSVTVLQRTRNDLPAILALYRRLGLDGGVTLQPLQEMDSYAQHYGDAVAAEALDAATVERIWIAFWANADLRAIEASRGAVRGFYDELMEGWRPALGTCPYLDRGLYVHRTGDVTPCCMVKDTARHGLGHVVTTPRETILARRQALADTLRSGTIPDACGGCEVARFAVMSRAGLVAFGLKGVRDRVAWRVDDVLRRLGARSAAP
ncbi:MAG: radical SAM protein [Alphaproteobacteria bacterium]|nr:radical SAM protein [Alphaproteobacteria bacterium]